MPVKRHSPAWDPVSSASFWINYTSRTILRLHESRLRPLGLSMGQLPVLIALAERGPLPQKELAIYANVEQPTMAELLARMEREGLVERAPNPEDRRGSLTKLTRSGRARLTKAKVALLENEALATAGLSTAKKTALIKLLRCVVAHVDPTSSDEVPTPAMGRGGPRKRQ